MTRDPELACILGALIGAVLMVAVVGMPGCTVTHETPSADRALDLADKIAGQMRNPSCPRLDLPPVPADVVLDIQGERVTANAGGEQLLRGYVQCRSHYR